MCLFLSIEKKFIFFVSILVVVEVSGVPFIYSIRTGSFVKVSILVVVEVSGVPKFETEYPLFTITFQSLLLWKLAVCGLLVFIDFNSIKVSILVVVEVSGVQILRFLKKFSDFWFQSLLLWKLAVCPAIEPFIKSELICFNPCCCGS